MCTPLECQAHFGQKGSRAERQSRCTAVFFVVALKVARGSPKGRKSAPARFLKALPRIGPKTEVHQTLCFTMRNCFRTKNWGPYFSKNVAPLQRQGPFGNLGELGTGSAFGLECCASTCEHSHGCPRSLCEAGRAQEPARTPPRANLMRPKRP